MEDSPLTSPLASTAPVPRAESADLQSSIESLRSLVIWVLFIVLCISGTLNMYLLRQARFAQKDLAAIKDNTLKMVDEYKRNNGPLMDNFVNQIAEYGRTHPDFAPIMTKYGIKPTIAPAGTPATPGTPSHAPAPAAPAAPKK